MVSAVSPVPKSLAQGTANILTALLNKGTTPASFPLLSAQNNNSAPPGTQTSHSQVKRTGIFPHALQVTVLIDNVINMYMKKW